MAIPATPPPAFVELQGEHLTFASIDRLVYRRDGEAADVQDLRMRLDSQALLGFLAGAIAGGPVRSLAIQIHGAHACELRAQAFGFPLRASLELTAARGRVLLRIDSASAGWLPISGQLVRDEILSSSQPAVIRSGAVLPVGGSQLSFAPDYLFSHFVAGFGQQLEQIGIPPHLRVHLQRVAFASGQVLVEGGP
ncbi:MAG: hypothetical protein KGR26_11015 [Cyanobacteria bacterium REEB65]|nr:hypothetical protein [Cyanobacteria bacterium REEB65]